MEPWTKADKERGRAGTFSELKTSLAHPRGSMPKVRWVGGGGEVRTSTFARLKIIVLIMIVFWSPSGAVAIAFFSVSPETSCIMNIYPFQ